MKIDMQSPNPCMRDPVAYRIKYTEHPHGGDKWCVYPTYDYTHCIVDSLEWITYSLCSLEFEIRRDSYYWLLEALDLYRPQVWEFSRLNLTYTLLSKRKIDRLVKEKIVNGWDDPRLGSVNGLRRRGFTASAINNFCDEIGVTRRSNENFTQIQFLEHHVRKELDVCAPRTFMVLDPIKVVLTNFDDKEEEDVEVPIFPNDKTKGNQIYKLCKNIFIDQSDFKDAEPIKGFWGLCRKQVVCLKYAHHIELEEVVYDSNNKVDHIKAKLIKNYEHKVKGYIHWISEKYSFNAEVRLYDNIFNVEDPNTIDDWIEHAKTQESIVIKGNAKGWKKIQNAKEFDHFQFERLGYFVVDKDSTKKKLVFNRTVGLVESKAKKALQ
jgi:glutaminyl-tRNA synthetase